MVNFADGIIQLQNMGVADVILPFLLVFTIVFAVLQKTQILGDKSEAKKYNGVVAFVMGLTLVFSHILGFFPPHQDPVNIINAALPNISVVLIAIVMVLLLLGVFGADVNILGNSLNGWVFFLMAAIVIYVFGTAAGYFGNGRFPDWLWFLSDPNTQSLLIVILVFGGIIWLIMREPDKDKKEKDPYLVPIYNGKQSGRGGGDHH